MAQKSNPISLRLAKTNKHWNSCWYGDRNYTEQLLKDCALGAHIENICQQAKIAPPVISINRTRQQMESFLFFPRQRLVRNQDKAPSAHRKLVSPYKGGLVELQSQGTEQNTKQLVRDGIQGPPFEKTGYFSPLSANEKRDIQVFSFHWQTTQTLGKDLRKESGEKGGFSINSNHVYSVNDINSLENNQVSSVEKAFCLRKKLDDKKKSFTVSSTANKKSKQVASVEKNTFKNHWENLISGDTRSRCKVHYLVCPSPRQNPFFLATQLVFCLEDRIPFRRLKGGIVREISRDSTIKGVRITCSGRVAARSKKAQKAKTELIQWGQTCLNVFSERVHFASKSARTAFGKIGVKVWICYK